MAEISDEELAELRRKAARADLPAPPGAEPEADPDAPPVPDKVALLASGDSYEYAGQHPTHVAVPGPENRGEGRVVPVLSVHPVF